MQAAAEGGGRAVAAEGNTLGDVLSKAHASHLTAMGALSPEGRRTHAKKGDLYELYKKLGRVARRVVPTESHLFSVSQHLRTAKRPKVTKAEADKPADGGKK